MYTVNPRILCVDDDHNVLDAMARNLRRHFDVSLAGSGREGLERVERDGPFAVVVSDQRMPEMDGVTFLARVRETSPETVRILLTGYADAAAAVGAVNRGAVFRFLSKPIETPELHQTLNAAVEQHRLVTAERVLLERTLHGSIKAIIDVLALVNPEGFGRALRAKETVSTLASALGIADGWQIEIAAMLAQVGTVALASGDARSATPANFGQVESAAVGQLSRIGADMVANIPRMEDVHAMLSHQDLRFDGSNGDSRGPRETAIPVGARMLKVAFELDVLESEGLSRVTALEAMKNRRGYYDPQLLEALSPRLAAAPVAASPTPPPELELELRNIEPGMTLGEPVRTAGGRVLIERGETVTAESLRRMKGTLNFNELRQSVRVVPAVPAAAAPEPIMAPPTPAPAPTAVDCGGMMLDLTMKLTV